VLRVCGPPSAAVIVLIVGVSGAILRAQQPITQRLTDVVRYNAPMIIAETQETCSLFPCASKAADQKTWPLVNHLLPVDFDGDFLGNNNLHNLNADDVVDQHPVAYYSVMETGSGDSDGYFYIGYYFYHGRDGGAFFLGKYWDSGHEHDMEGLLLVVKKSPVLPYGVPVLAMTEAHSALIPFGVPGQVDFNFNLNQGGIGSWGGQVEFWHDDVFGVDRPVVAIRAGTHGTYMAQDCYAGDGSYYYDGFGMYKPRALGGGYTACIHQNDNFILYTPAVADATVAPMGNSVVTGMYEYQLRHLATSPLWTERMNLHELLGGTNHLDLGYGVTAQDIFEPLDYYGSVANPPWAWRGGPGDPSYFFGNGGYWYNFAEDGTSNAHFSPGQWSEIPVGSLLMNPSAAARSLWQMPGNFYEDEIFNAYRDVIPPPPHMFSADISGPEVLNVGSQGTWYAVVSYGTPPYTYQWSGLAYGTDQSVSGAVYNDGDIYLDVWDATGAHLAISKHVTSTGCSGGNLC